MAGVLVAAVLAAGATPATHAPRAYYLSLGDSIAYGFQPTKDGKPPSAFNTGFVDVFAARLQKIKPKLKVVNYGCPGETTVSYVRGSCEWTADGRKLHDPHPGSQEQAALAFLAAHPGQVSPITVVLWGNDVARETENCGSDAQCTKQAPKVIAGIGSRLGAILKRLRAAAPGAEILVLGAWNPQPETDAVSDRLHRQLNDAIGRAALSARARRANVLPVYNPNPPGAARKRTICFYTFACKNDPHPTDAGYRAMANAFFRASGY